jgi:prepilin-type N-terminal cleavage/methylation domain-containing protein
MCHRRAFTLIELLVVVTIIVVLLALLTPAMEGAFEEARKAACGSNLRQIGASVHMYGQDQRMYIPTPSEYVDAGGTPEELWYNQMAGWFWFEGDYYYGYGILWKNGYLKGAEKVFYCPGQTPDRYRYDTYVNPSFHPTSSGFQVFVSYFHNPLTEEFYDPAMGGGNAKRRQPYHKNLQDLGSRMILGLDQVLLRNEGGKLVGVAHADQAGWNVMLGDSSVNFRHDPRTRSDLYANPDGMRNDNYILYDQALARLLHGQ